MIKGVKLTPKLIVISSVAVVAVALTTTYGLVRYNADQVAKQAQVQEEKKQLELAGIATIETGGSGEQSGATQNSANDTSSSTTSPSVKPNSGTQTPSSNSTGSTNTTNPTTTPPASTSPVDNDTPQVTLTYPSVWGQTVSGVITITANASDAGGIQKIVFMIRKIGVATPVFSSTDTTAPYSASFDTRTLPNGGSDYTVEAQVFDNVGQGNLASLRINIQN